VLFKAGPYEAGISLIVRSFLLRIASFSSSLWKSRRFRALKWLIGAALIFVALRAGCSMIEPSTSLTYKLLVDVDDNGTLRHGEGVIKVVFQSMGWFLIDNTPQWAVWPDGEAFPVDLGPRGILFVLLSEDRGRRTSCDAGRGAMDCYFNFFVNDLPNGAGSIAKMGVLGASHAALDFAPDRLPMLARFRDINDPRTAEIVDPKHLDASFGPGVKIVKARAEITHAPVTKGIEKILPWVGTPKRTLYLGPPVMDKAGIEVINGLYAGSAEAHFK
jgi:hypothetical protein